MFDTVFDKMLDLAEEHLDEDMVEGIRSFVEDVQAELEAMGDDPEPGPDPEDETDRILGFIPTWEEITDRLDEGIDFIERFFTDAETRSQVFSNAMDRLGNSARHIAGIFGRLVTEVPGLNQAISAFQAAPDPITGAVAALASFITETEGFQDIIEFAGNAFGMLIEMLEPVAEALMPAFKNIIVAVLTILEPFIPILEGFAKAVAWVTDLFIGIWNAVIDALAKAGDVIDFFTFGLFDAGDSIRDMKIEVDEVAQEVEDFKDTTDDATSSMRNVPEGVKIANEAFKAADPQPIIEDGQKETNNILEEIKKMLEKLPFFDERAAKKIAPDLLPSAASGGYVTSSGVAEVHKGEIIANKQQQSEMGGNINITIEGDIWGVDDLDRKIKRSVDKATKRQGLGRYGLNTAGGN